MGNLGRVEQRDRGVTLEAVELARGRLEVGLGRYELGVLEGTSRRQGRAQ